MTIMKPSVAATLLLATPILGCLTIRGSLGWTAREGYKWIEARVIDNGATVCTTDWGWRIDNDGHPSLSCLPGYIYATNGDTSWYANNGGGSWTIDNHASTAPGSNEWSWDTSLFC